MKTGFRQGFTDLQLEIGLEHETRVEYEKVLSITSIQVKCSNKPFKKNMFPRSPVFPGCAGNRKTIRSCVVAGGKGR